MRPQPGFHGLQFHPFHPLRRQFRGQPRVAAFEVQHPMRAGHAAVQLVHLEMIEIVRAGRAEYRERDPRYELIREAGARSKHSRDLSGLDRDLHRHARASRHPCRIHALRVDGKSRLQIRCHGFRRVHAHFPGTVARVERTSHNVAVLFGGLPIALHRHPPVRAPIECEDHAPLPGRCVIRRKIQRIVLGIVQDALYAVDNLARGNIGGAGRRGGHQQHDDFLRHALNHSV